MFPCHATTASAVTSRTNAGCGVIAKLCEKLLLVANSIIEPFELEFIRFTGEDPIPSDSIVQSSI
jgi:hypothetical protein